MQAFSIMTIRPLRRNSRSVERLTCCDNETIIVTPAMRQHNWGTYREFVPGCIKREIVGRTKAKVDGGTGWTRISRFAADGWVAEEVVTQRKGRKIPTGRVKRAWSAQDKARANERGKGRV